MNAKAPVTLWSYGCFVGVMGWLDAGEGFGLWRTRLYIGTARPRAPIAMTLRVRPRRRLRRCHAGSPGSAFHGSVRDGLRARYREVA
jgi:hypothetical protein